VSPGSLSLYLHIPWCRVRCGYCDFNTYVLGSAAPDLPERYQAALLAELGLAAERLGPRRVETIYFGGGTPTLMAPPAFAALLGRIGELFDVAPDAEITTEANPETVTPASLAQLRQAGITRLSLGMQSAVPHLLATLERVHTPGRAVEAVGWARAAGFASVSLDLIYATPGETLTDWEHSVETALAAEPDHLSAYSLIVEPGTRLAARIARGELPAPQEDAMAERYLLADERFNAAGLAWYEVSNWARPGHECRHNLAYWRSGDWWGFGAGSHSHVAGVRWWNERHPRTYAERIEACAMPVAGSEELTDEDRHMETVMLGLRLREGLLSSALTASEQTRVPALVDDGLVTVMGERIVCTQRGRLLADGVVRDLLD
jgi:oxygen-independent coproporphyrinogen-3 oxidase